MYYKSNSSNIHTIHSKCIELINFWKKETIIADISIEISPEVNNY